VTTIVGISGKIGAGKDYLGSHLITELEARGFTAGNVSFAYPLKNQLNQIIADMLTVDLPNLTTGYTLAVKNLSTHHNVPMRKMMHLTGLLIEELQADLTLHAYARTPGIRSALQYLGTNIRRAQDDHYWVKLFLAGIREQTVDFAVVTDVRFPNEANAIRDHGGYLLRLEVPVEIILDQTRNRDGLTYTAEQLNHDSELALDDYPNFDMVVGRDFDTAQIVDSLDTRHREAETSMGTESGKRTSTPTSTELTQQLAEATATLTVWDELYRQHGHRNNLVEQINDLHFLLGDEAEEPERPW